MLRPCHAGGRAPSFTPTVTPVEWMTGSPGARDDDEDDDDEEEEEDDLSTEAAQ